jgi:hypothetical protein
MKLYQFIDDFAQAAEAVNGQAALLGNGQPELRPPTPSLRCDMAKSVTTPTL